MKINPTKLILYSALLSLLSLTSCKSDTPDPPLKLMTQNLYLGASLHPLLSDPAGPADPTAVAKILKAMEKTNFPARARALAKIIHSTRPNVLALQEVSHLRIVDAAGKTTMNVDFLSILLNELKNLGMEYTVAANALGPDIMVPLFISGAFTASVHYKGYNTILIDSSLTASGSKIKNYDKQQSTPIGLTFTRNYVKVTLSKIPNPWELEEINDIVIVNTHLEAGSKEVQEAQASELVNMLGTIDEPIFLLGDINSAANNVVKKNQTNSYPLLISSSFKDPYLELNPTAPPISTCCYDEHLSSNKFVGEGRIDHILYKNNSFSQARPTRFSLTGNKLGDKTIVSDEAKELSLWPSDHLGVVVEFTNVFSTLIQEKTDLSPPPPPPSAPNTDPEPTTSPEPMIDTPPTIQVPKLELTTTVTTDSLPHFRTTTSRNNPGTVFLYTSEDCTGNIASKKFFIGDAGTVVSFTSFVYNPGTYDFSARIWRGFEEDPYTPCSNSVRYTYDPPPVPLNAPKLTGFDLSSTPSQYPSPRFLVTTTNDRKGEALLYQSEDCTGESISSKTFDGPKNTFLTFTSLILEPGIYNFSTEVQRGSAKTPCSNSVHYLYHSITAPKLILAPGSSSSKTIPRFLMTTTNDGKGEALLYQSEDCTGESISQSFTGDAGTVVTLQSLALDPGTHTFSVQVQRSSDQTPCSNNANYSYSPLNAPLLALDADPISLNPNPSFQVTTTNDGEGRAFLYKSENCTGESISNKVFTDNSGTIVTLISPALEYGEHIFSVQVQRGDDKTPCSNNVNYMRPLLNAPTLSLLYNGNPSDSPIDSTFNFLVTTTNDGRGEAFLYQSANCSGKSIHSFTTNSETDINFKIPEPDPGRHTFSMRIQQDGNWTSCSNNVSQYVNGDINTPDLYLHLGYRKSSYSLNYPLFLIQLNNISNGNIFLYKSENCEGEIVATRTIIPGFDSTMNIKSPALEPGTHTFSVNIQQGSAGNYTYTPCSNKKNYVFLFLNAPEFTLDAVSSSPSANSKPSFLITTTNIDNGRAFLYQSADCSGEGISKNFTGGWGKDISFKSLELNPGTHIFSARVQRARGWTFCSDPLTYTYQPLTPPVLALPPDSNPSSLETTPSFLVTTTNDGIGEAFLYKSANCKGESISSKIFAGNTNTDITLRSSELTPGTHTFSVKIQRGNSWTACSNSFTYTRVVPVATPPTLALVSGSTSMSLDATPSFLLTTTNDGQGRAFLYKSADCSGDTVSSRTFFGNTNTVLTLRSSELTRGDYKFSVQVQRASVKTPCSNSVPYTYTPSPFKAPNLNLTNSSPSSTKNTPKFIITAKYNKEWDGEVFLYQSPDCSGESVSNRTFTGGGVDTDVSLRSPKLTLGAYAFSTRVQWRGIQTSCSNSVGYTHSIPRRWWQSNILGLNMKISDYFSDNLESTKGNRPYNLFEQMMIAWNESSPKYTFFNIPDFPSNANDHATPNLQYSNVKNYKDNVMGIYAHETWFNYVGSESTIAVTLFFFNRKNIGTTNEYKEYTHADILFNYRDHKFTFNKSGPAYLNITSVLLHELGHVIGLDHPPKGNIEETIMSEDFQKFLSTSPKQTLSPYDINSVLQHYDDNPLQITTSSQQQRSFIQKKEGFGIIQLQNNGDCLYYENGKLMHKHSVDLNPHKKK